MRMGELIALILGIPLVICAVGVSVGYQVGLEQAFQAGLTAALVFVTAYYAYSTRRILDATKEQSTIATKQAEIMLEGQFQAEAPVMKLRTENATNIRIEVENIGKGPALNVKCWIDDPQQLDLQNNQLCWAAIAVGGNHHRFIDTEIEGYSLKKGCVRAQYESIFTGAMNLALFILVKMVMCPF